MTSSNENIFRVTGHLCGEVPSQRPVTRSFDISFDLRLNKRKAGDLRRYRTHYDVIVVFYMKLLEECATVYTISQRNNRRCFIGVYYKILTRGTVGGVKIHQIGLHFARGLEY